MCSPTKDNFQPIEFARTSLGEDQEHQPSQQEMNASELNPARYSSFLPLLNNASEAFTYPHLFDPSEDNLAILREDKKVLVVGAGGLGCEILKNLALSGVADIHVIDIDTIDLSNLNRQFLFRHKDIGKPKSTVAAEFIMNRCKGVKVTPHHKKIQEFPRSYYKQFDIVVAGLDNVEARRWLNAVLVDLVEYDDDGNPKFESIIPFIDGGTEGFMGQARLFLPRLTSCFECSVKTLPPQQTFALCTIATVPRLPEHCVAYVKQKIWPLLLSFNTAKDYELYELKSDNDRSEPNKVELDTDNAEHMKWLYERALERANEFKITGVTYSLTMQVVKNIIPAIASTNALIAAACCNEAFKMLTLSSMQLNNYLMYMGHTGTYTNTFEFDKDKNCLICGAEAITYKLDPTTTVQQLKLKLMHDPATKLKQPTFSANGRTFYSEAKNLAKLYVKNREKPISDFVRSDDPFTVTDVRVMGKRAASIRVQFVEGEFFVPPEE